MYVVRRERFQPTPIALSSPIYAAFVGAFQLLWYSPCKLVLTLAMRPKTRVNLSAHHLVGGRKYVLAANHQSMIDPFVICCALPLSLLRRLGPFRYFAHAGLFNGLLLRTLLLCFGAFPTRPFRHWPYGIEAARAFLGRGQSVIIFPEGKRTLPEVVPARKGVGELALDPLVTIIPVRLEWTSTKFRRRYRLVIGEPLPASTEPQEILEQIYRLKLPK